MKTVNDNGETQTLDWIDHERRNPWVAPKIRSPEVTVRDRNFHLPTLQEMKAHPALVLALKDWIDDQYDYDGFCRPGLSECELIVRLLLTLYMHPEKIYRDGGDGKRITETLNDSAGAGGNSVQNSNRRDQQ